MRQQGYGSFDAVTYDVDGVTVYVPADGGQIGYDKFPSPPGSRILSCREKESMREISGMASARIEKRKMHNEYNRKIR